jgi:hypothetical protein
VARANLGFTEVSFDSPVLDMVQALMDAEEAGATVPDQKVDLRLEDGRLSQGPLSLKVQGHHLVASGSVGLDQTIKFAVQVPITEKMLPGEGLMKYVEGARLTASLGGTLANPRLEGRDSLRKSLREVIATALRKKALDALFD